MQGAHPLSMGLAAAAISVAAWSGTAQGAPVIAWNESNSGDITDFSQPGTPGSTNLGLLQPNTTYRVLGGLTVTSIQNGTANPDPFDIFQFRVPGDFTVNVTDTGTGVRLGLDEEQPFGNFTAFVSVAPTQPNVDYVLAGPNVFGADGQFGSGNYSIELRLNSSNSLGDATYAIDIVTGAPTIVLPPGGGGGDRPEAIPLPASLPLMLAGLGGLACLRRKRRV